MTTFELNRQRLLADAMGRIGKSFAAYCEAAHSGDWAGYKAARAVYLEAVGDYNRAKHATPGDRLEGPR